MYWMNQSIYLLHTFMYDRFYIFSEVTVPPRHFFVEKLARCFAVKKWAPLGHFTLIMDGPKHTQKMQSTTFSALTFTLIPRGDASGPLVYSGWVVMLTITGGLEQSCALSTNLLPRRDTK